MSKDTWVFTIKVDKLAYVDGMHPFFAMEGPYSVGSDLPEGEYELLITRLK